MKVKYIDFGLKAKGFFPSRKHDNDAGIDCPSPIDYTLQPGETYALGLGFGLEVPAGMVAYVFPRSSLSGKGIGMNLPPIDSGYKGEIHAVLNNLTDRPYEIKAGDRVGQLVILPCVIADLVDDIDDSRGTGAFGSTGR